MEQKTKKREWVKTAAIIFLAVLLVLTFFSNTIMNRSLPEVATAYVQPGSINAKIRGTGTISANETYDVTIGQARKVQSVVVRVGDEIKTGDTLFVLDPAESTELQAAREQLSAMELSYQQALISAGNESAQENRSIQKLRDAYNEALATYNFYSTVDPSQLKKELVSAEAQLKSLQRDLEDEQKAYSKAQTDKTYTEYQGKIASLKSELEHMQEEINELYVAWVELQEKVGTVTPDHELEELRRKLREEEEASQAGRDAAEAALQTANQNLVAAQNTYQKQYNELTRYARFSLGVLDPSEQQLSEEMDILANNRVILKSTIVNTGVSEESVTDEMLDELIEAYSQINSAEAAVAEAEQKLTEANAELVARREALANAMQSNGEVAIQQKDADAAKLKYDTKRAEYQTKSQDLLQMQNYVTLWENKLEQMEFLLQRAEDAADAQQDTVNRYNDAINAASNVTSAKEALEDALFQASLGDASNLNLQNDKEKIEKQKQTIAELEESADAVEVKAKVSGVISELNITAGNTASPDMPLATITIRDRGYTVQISATTEQARRVQVGDQATISNYYYGNATATLEKIATDPKDPSRSKILIFRLSGDGIEPGANITLAIGQKSATYDALVPNSAVRTDSNGSFVLVVSEKKTPLSSRYVAKRADVTVLGSDDTSSAISGVSSGDFVITTAARPVEAGDQVRLVDES